MTELKTSLPKITVVTVVFNGAISLESTIKSVLNQNYPNLEYLIIDGGSTDGSLEIIKKYQSKISQWISEPDFGIYHAMNKGIQMATGDWINFMNSGDRFSDDQVLHDVFFSKDFFNVSVIYGSWKVFYPATKRVQSRKAPSHLDLNYGSQFCHQASFIKTAVHKEFPYSLEESIVADFSFFFTLWKKGEVFQLIDRDVCIIEAGGVSDKKRGQVIRSWRMIVKPKLLKYKIYFSFRLLRESSVSLFKSISNWDL